MLYSDVYQVLAYVTFYIFFVCEESTVIKVWVSVTISGNGVRGSVDQNKDLAFGFLIARQVVKSR